MVLQVKGISKHYGTPKNLTRAVENLSFNVNAGEFVGIMGASGSGKTTLLNCISTIDTVTSGQILIEENDITRLSQDKLTRFRREKLGFVFQDFNLLDTLTAYENIALALTILKIAPREIDARVQDISTRLDIAGILKKYPYELSGGERQRVACARAMVTHPALVLADEPTGALDSKSSGRLLQGFEMLNEEMGATILMVTHDAFTASFCRRILYIRDGQICRELLRGDTPRRAFFDQIIGIVSELGGDGSNVL